MSLEGISPTPHGLRVPLYNLTKAHSADSGSEAVLARPAGSIPERSQRVRRRITVLAKFGAIFLAGFVGGVLMHTHTPGETVHAQDQFSGGTNCITVVPKTWGNFKGGSAYGLAFEDHEGNVRFILRPTCGSLNSPAEPPAAQIDLEIQRR